MMCRAKHAPLEILRSCDRSMQCPGLQLCLDLQISQQRPKLFSRGFEFSVRLSILERRQGSKLPRGASLNCRFQKSTAAVVQ